jgi:hypothetical protein
MKLQLEVKLISDKTLQMKLIYICDEAIKDSHSREAKIFQDDNGITIWSFSDFVFDNRQIRLPQSNMKLCRTKHTYQFKTEEERYETLKKFYNTLTRWSLNTKMFPNTNTNIKKRITIIQNFWNII